MDEQPTSQRSLKEKIMYMPPEYQIMCVGGVLTLLVFIIIFAFFHANGTDSALEPHPSPQNVLGTFASSPPNSQSQIGPQNPFGPNQPLVSPSPTPSPTPSKSPVPTPSPTPTPTSAPASNSSPDPSPTDSPTPSPTQTASASATPHPTATP